MDAGQSQVPDQPVAENRGTAPTDEPQQSSAEDTDEDCIANFESDSEAHSADKRLVAFSRGLHRLNRGNLIAPRFFIRARFPPLLPVGFKPETIEHYQTLGTGNVNVGRSEEAAKFHNTAASALSPTTPSTGSRRTLLSGRRFRGVIRRRQATLLEPFGSISDAKVPVFGTYELSDSRDEV